MEILASLAPATAVAAATIEPDAPNNKAKDQKVRLPLLHRSAKV
jgi:hypothetical protein